MGEKKLPRVATLTQNHLACTVSNAGTNPPQAPKWWAWRSRPVPETNVRSETLHSRDAERHVLHCTPIASGAGEADMGSARARAAESAVVAGFFKRSYVEETNFFVEKNPMKS